MTEQPTKPVPGSDDDFRQRTLQAAWKSAQECVEAVCASIVTNTESPAFLSVPDVERRRSQFAHRRFMEIAIEAIYVAEWALQTAVQSGAVSPDRAAHAKDYAAKFVLSCLNGQRCYCKGSELEAGVPCQWSGLMDEAGPAMLCPACGNRTLDLLSLDTSGNSLPGEQPPPPRLRLVE